MIVTCESCHTKFKLDDSKITDKGIKVRCSKCQSVFLVKKAAEEYSMAPDEIKKAIDEALGAVSKPPSVSKEGGVMSEDVGFSKSLSGGAKEQQAPGWGEVTFSEEPHQAGPQHSLPGGGGVKSGGTTMDVGQELDFGNIDVGEDTEEKIDFGAEEGEEEPREDTGRGETHRESEKAVPAAPGSVSGGVPIERKTVRPPPQGLGQEVSITKLLTLLFLLGILGGGGIMYLKGGLALSGLAGIFSHDETKKPGQIELAGMKGNYFQNIRGQQLFIIEGRAINGFDIQRSFVKLRGILFDGSGAEIASREIYGGWSFSEDELRNLSSKEIDERLGNKMGESLSNFNIAPNGPIPFMVVFYDVPGTISSFSVVVVESQGSAQ